MSYTIVNDPASVRVYNISGDDKTVVDAARVSLASLDEMHGRVKSLEDAEDARECTERDIKLINYLAREKHYSCFEHSHITLWVEVPIYIARQHMRHRTWSYNEVSRRYTSEDIRVYEPLMFRAQSKSNRQASTDEAIDPVLKTISGHYQDYDVHATDAVAEHNRDAINTYHKLLNNGVCREQARGVLPMGLLTQYYASVNLRNFAAFIRERKSSHAQSEMQTLATKMYDAIIEHFPISLKALLE
tara:strand:+ start:2342 stop:3076 length:735 start_codon:yes stop_codon:yes gene_type:complete